MTNKIPDRAPRPRISVVLGFILLVTLPGCTTATFPNAPTIFSADTIEREENNSYLIGPDDHLNVVVWRQAELSAQSIVRPDGRISVPLLNDVVAAGTTPTALSNAIADGLKEYVQDPKVTVIVTSFVGPFNRQIRVIGEATRPQAIPFRSNMTVLDVMIQVGGLTPFARANHSILARAVPNGSAHQYRLRLGDLLNNGDSNANAYVMPGDVIIIPQTFF